MLIGFPDQLHRPNQRTSRPPATILPTPTQHGRRSDRAGCVRTRYSRCMTTRLKWIVAVLSCSATVAVAQPASEPRIALALGGGAARGLAHIGVLRWLEEHR